ncbi:SDR family NAD(P)-dependent oxidoreductase [Actinomadura sp. RB99]|uniref:SDR family NAD(P)-dependent oxidoreductase n=1 Tax=Actinomadura sp. RB99 TaxID=2691577 RepID=UPI001F510F18|nr:SDR family NAD(P)-dependent oxidoreductase [Actinomadura sp. RB99]
MHGLTRRELDVLRVLARGRSNPQIAAELFALPAGLGAAPLLARIDDLASRGRLGDGADAPVGNGLALGGDLADPRLPARLLREAAEALLGPVDPLIPNAGHAVQQDYTMLDSEAWERTLVVNLRAPFLLVQHALPGMAQRGFGRVLFMSPRPPASPAASSARTTPPPRRGCTA